MPAGFFCVQNTISGRKCARIFKKILFHFRLYFVFLYQICFRVIWPLNTALWALFKHRLGINQCWAWEYIGWFKKSWSNEVEFCQIKVATFMKYFTHNYLILILVKFCTIIKIGGKKNKCRMFPSVAFLLNHLVFYI